MPIMRDRRRLGVWLGLAVIYVIWGSTYFGIAIAIETIPPFFMAAARFAIAGLALLLVDLARNPEARHWPTRRELRDSAIVGTLLLGIGNGFVAFGEMTVPSSIAAILIGMMPVWFAIFGWLYFRERLPRIVAFAIAIGFAGVAVLLWPSGAGANQFDLFGILILLLAPLGWGHGSLFAAHRAKLPSRPLVASGLQMLAGAAALLVEGLIAGEPARLDLAAISPASLAALVYLTLFGSMLAYTTYGWLLRHAPISLIATYAYVNPVVAVFLGTVFLHESISFRTLIASAVIVAAVAIIVTARGRLPASPKAAAEDADPAAPGTRAARGRFEGPSISPARPSPKAPSG